MEFEIANAEYERDHSSFLAIDRSVVALGVEARQRRHKFQELRKEYAAVSEQGGVHSVGCMRMLRNTFPLPRATNALVNAAGDQRKVWRSAFRAGCGRHGGL